MTKPSPLATSSRIVCIAVHDPYVGEDLHDQLGFFGFSVYRLESFLEVEGFLDGGRRVVLIVDTAYLEEGDERETSLEHLVGSRREDLSVIYLSERDTFDVRLNAVRAGGDAFFSSPVDISRLIDKIDSLASRHHQEPYHILIVDDDQEQISNRAHILQQAGMITSVASDPRNVFSVLIEAKPELILMDLRMPGCDGIELARLIRQQEAFVGIPIVFLSGERDRGRRLRAISQGGDDFLITPIKPEHLVTSLQIRIERTRDMRYFMERDSLTGLLNHSNLKERLAHETHRAGRIGNELCFAMIDLDHFKNVNDTYGHLTGDTVLKSLSRLLQDRLRKSDIIGRYGGEEFGVILFNTSLENARAIMNEIRESFALIRHQFGGKEFYVSFSCGLAGFPTHDTANGLSEAADRALYEAKETGRNRVVLA